MSNVPRMCRNERRILIRTGRESGDGDTAMRFLIIAHLASGKSGSRVAQDLGASRSTVTRVEGRFIADGIDGLYDRRRGNGGTKADDPFRRRVAQLLRGTPEDVGWARPTWTRELLCLQMKEEGFAAVAVCTVGRALARLGARLGTPKPIVLCPWKRDARLQRLAEIGALENGATAAEPVLYSDEVDIHLNPKIGDRRQLLLQVSDNYSCRSEPS